MWPQFISEYLSQYGYMDYYLEAVSSATASTQVKSVLQAATIKGDFVADNVELIDIDDAQFARYYFPLRDYRGDQDPSLKPVGFVLVWHEVSDLVAAFKSSVWINIVYAICGFIVLESVLLWFFNREFRLFIAEQEATIDGLTGIYNRRYFDKSLGHEMLCANRSKADLALILCDVDYFKQYNDHNGHVDGDRCLKQVATIISQVLQRGSDWSARYGGEEFATVLPGTNLEGACLFAERIRIAVESAHIPHGASTVGPWVTVSIGVACSSADKQCSGCCELIRAADKNLYKAKLAGRNIVVAEAAEIPT